ncbi:hypothetical protein MIMGU_mgv11b015721mg, partial [Erythranthe guttata]
IDRIRNQTLSISRLSISSSFQEPIVGSSGPDGVREAVDIGHGFIMAISASLHSMSTYGDKGSPWRNPRLHAGKVLANEIAFIDSPISVDYLTLYNLNGLGSKFRKVFAPIRFRESALTFEELHDMLVGHENYMRSLDSTAHTLVATTNSTQFKYFGSSRIPSNKNGDATRRGSYDHGKPWGNYRRSSVKP